MKWPGWCRIRGSASTSEIPRLPWSFYLFYSTGTPTSVGVSALSDGFIRRDPSRRHSQVGSLAGAAHLLNDNTGVLG